MSESRNPLSLDEQVCFALSVASRTVIGSYRDVLEPLGLTHPQYLVMLALWESDGLTLRGLSDVLRLEPATVSPLVKRLEAAGLVRRDRRPDDDRAFSLTVTAQGRALREQALAVPTTMLERFDMDVAELEQVNRWLRELIDRADRAQERTTA
ncbi:MarR family transcriptional regulator [Aeromicrobium sp. 636]|uniref:MarR family transcriptional regulator n=1 Tax=Aeromicrobium senzhongii TaxID=2663859 RepID=A0A8I0EVA9_9ACTN|nr:MULTISPECIES: MarR family transcriptional regulator [Aeromicrobium]MBC9225782.1 MarR family transcriptional regulator [Aeromicrobium senzhongii]MCQ3997891.1 MarR family transcriptional regulator [Aeromicrobium sp. 636]MTB87819.1 MarR family transcriptional regulator [Aeromicrobium senzhongii]QNL95160.1 MarR family transcriptional regulator [Aeromicrobium senzhongii]